MENKVQQDTRLRSGTLATSVAKSRRRNYASSRKPDQSGELFRTLFWEAPVGMVLSDFAGRICEANPTACTILGCDQAELKLLKTPRFFARPKQWHHLTSTLRRAGRAALSDLLLCRPDGSSFVGSVQVVWFGHCDSEWVLSIYQDLTDQKRVEWRTRGLATLAKLSVGKSPARGYLKAVVEHLRDWCQAEGAGIRLFGGDGQPSFAVSKGLPRRLLTDENQMCRAAEECACLTIHSSVPQPAGWCKTAAQGHLSSDERIEGQESTSTIGGPADGILSEEAGFKSVACTRLEWNGRVEGVLYLATRRREGFSPDQVEFIRDVAPVIGQVLNRFALEQTLRDNEIRFRGWFEKNEAVMLLIDPKSGCIEAANPAAMRFYGLSRETLCSLRMGDLGILLPGAKPPSNRTGWCETWRQFETATGLAGRADRVVRVQASPYLTQGRQLLFSILHDITEQRRLQNQMVEACELERRRIGQDLHDSLGGLLTGLALLGKALAQSLSGGHAGVELAEEIVAGINEGIVRTRTIAHGLSPIDSSPWGLINGLRELAAGVRRRTGVDCQVQASKSVRVSEQVSLHLFRIAEEAVQNALRHGNPARIQIRLIQRRTGVSLRVWNDGKPLDESRRLTEGLGLRTMRYRAELIGARFDLRCVDGGRTVASCVLLGEHAGDSQEDPLAPNRGGSLRSNAR